MRLFSYIITDDSGFAPNPFWGVLTLNCCKPDIRRVAEVGDWVAGITAADFPAGRGLLVYAMRVTEKMTLGEYDAWTLANLPQKIPARGAYERQAGDSIYDYSDGQGEPRRRKRGWHYTPDEIRRDLDGRFTLLSSAGDFYYFGARAVEIPEHLREITRIRRRHRNPSNDAYVEDFEEWITHSFEPGVHGQPALKPVAKLEPSPVTIGRKP